MPAPGQAMLVAIGDLHVEVPENRDLVARLSADSSEDWLIICGDIGEVMSDIQWALRTLAGRFEKVIWVPGNHELWTRPDDPMQLRGDARYRYIVAYCQDHGIVTPEDPFPVWNAPQPVVIAPLFTLYDYTFGRNIGSSKRESLARAAEAGVVCSDEFLLFPDPYSSIEEWCRERVLFTLERLKGATLPSVLVSHFPLLEELTQPLLRQEFAQWCGTLLTSDWHRRFDVSAVVYGHLHIPRSTVHDGVPFEEVSLGYPREWTRKGSGRPALRRILPNPGFA